MSGETGGAAAGSIRRPVAASRAGRTLAVVGSLNPVTAEQIRALARHPGVVVRRLSRSALRAGRLSAPRGAACWIVCLEPASFRRVRPAAVDGIAASLGRVAVTAFTAFRPGRLFLSGGLTALAVCRALGIAELELLGIPAAGLTAARATTGGRPVEILTKPGGFGSRDALAMLAGAAA